jgi:hypothetical protein
LEKITDSKSTKYVIRIVSPVVSMAEALELIEFCYQNEIAHVTDGFDNFLQDNRVEFHEC